MWESYLELCSVAPGERGCIFCAGDAEEAGGHAEGKGRDED